MKINDLKRKARNKPLTMAQGGGKPTFVVPKRVWKQENDFRNARKRRERVSFCYPINGEVLEVLYDRKWAA
jgi:hypothetical protein